MLPNYHVSVKHTKWKLGQAKLIVKFPFPLTWIFENAKMINWILATAWISKPHKNFIICLFQLFQLIWKFLAIMNNNYPLACVILKCLKQESNNQLCLPLKLMLWLLVKLTKLNQYKLCMFYVVLYKLCACDFNSCKSLIIVY